MQFSEYLHAFPDGVKTKLVSEGRNLSRGQIQRLLIARAIVGRPRLLILDEAFTGVDEQDKIRILDEIFGDKHSWTIINISHDPEVVARTKTIHVLKDGRLIETVSVAQINETEYPAFNSIFPTMISFKQNIGVPKAVV